MVHHRADLSIFPQKAFFGRGRDFSEKWRRAPAVVHCLLSPVRCLLSTVYCLLPTVYCLLSTVYCLLSTVYCLLSTVYCLRFCVALTAEQDVLIQVSYSPPKSEPDVLVVR